MCDACYGPSCFECGLLVCMDCDDASDAYDGEGTPHKCHRACVGAAQDRLDDEAYEEG